jgi:ubiquinone/menaquinone biosynthesis C-methylase UbiE
MGIKPGMIVADFGSGSGHYIFPLAEAVGKTGRVYAIDVQRDLLRRIKNEARRRTYHHVDVLWGDVESPGGSKLADEFADIVLMSNILFQLEDKYAALNEAGRILKPHGKLVIIDWHGGAPDQDSDEERMIFTPSIGPHRRDIVSRAEALEFARSTGYEPVRDLDVGSYHYGILFRKKVIINTAL